MDLDDLPIGRVLTRREALTLLGSTGGLLLLGSSSSGASAAGRPRYPCVVRPASTAGPFYVDEKLDRSDIRSDPADGTVKTGALLTLTFNVSSIAKGRCSPLAGAMVDVWHCDAEGVYSDADDGRIDTTGRKFLRGYQITDQQGVVTFTTIYPGWYPSRTPHIHYKIRSTGSARSPYEFVGQLYFDEGTNDRVYAKAPYDSRGKRTVSNITDQIYSRDGGRQSMLTVTPAREGYTGTFDIALEQA
ncbi:MAG: twin-arginine translocation pathway signal protein [Gemmatimonadales bacterium]